MNRRIVWFGKVVSCRPDFFQNEPFRENFEGFLFSGMRVAPSSAQFKTHDFQDSTLRVIGGKPLPAKRLRKFKHFGSELCRFVVVWAVLKDVLKMLRFRFHLENECLTE